MKATTIFSLSSVLAITNAFVKRADSTNALSFENFGYPGSFLPVLEMKDIYSDSCTCSVADPVQFNGATSPLDGEVSVHFRGPLVLHKFAAYTSGDYDAAGSGSGSWSRIANFDDSVGNLENVTFLTNAGRNSSCLGKGLTYAARDGVSAAESSVPLGKNTLLTSNQEFAIFSNVSCGSSGLNNDCGVYRPEIPAYHGFYGRTKMFLFEFQMPRDNSTSSEWVANLDMPAIWLLNANIPRTSQYSNNVNCSCWRSGCGEFDIFEVKNNTNSLVDRLFTTIHDYQGTGDIEMGLQVDGFIPRPEGTVRGGVSFDSKGNAVAWVSNSTSFDSTISGSDLKGWVKSSGSVITDELASVSATPLSSKSSSKKSMGTNLTCESLFTKIWAMFVGIVLTNLF
jgi:hypothetical protein